MQRGYRVTAICHDKRKGEPGFALHPDVAFVNAYHRAPFWNRAPFSTLRWISLNKHTRRHNRAQLKAKRIGACIAESVERFGPAQCILSFQAESAYLLKELLHCTAPIVTMFHGHPQMFFNDPNFAQWASAVDACDALNVLLPEYVDQTRKRLPHVPISCIGNCIPQFQVQPELKAKTIICVSRLAREKRVELLLDAFAIVHAKFADWKLEYWGETDIDKKFRQNVRDQIAAKGLTDHFLLCGATNDIPDKLAQASIFAFASAFEGFSLALGEAMSMGLPAVGCVDCESVRSLIDHETNGLLTDPTPEAFAAGIIRLIEEPALRTRLGSQAKASMHAYRAEAIWGAWDRLIHTITDQRR